MGNLTIPEFAERYKIGKSKIYEEISAGRLEAVKYGKKTLIPVKSAEAWQAALPRFEIGKAA